MSLIQLEGESDEQFHHRVNRMKLAERVAQQDDMDPVYAAQLSVHAIARPKLFKTARRSDHGTDAAHMAWMFLEIAKGEMSIGKANRWLGWAQALAARYNYLTLKQCKEINRRAG